MKTKVGMLLLSVVLVMSLVITGCPPVQVVDPVPVVEPVRVWELTLQTYKGPGFPEWEHSLPRFVERVYEGTGGRVKITLKPPGALVGCFEAFEAVGLGALDMAFNAAGYQLGMIPVTWTFFLPFTTTTWEQKRYLWTEMGLEELYRQEYLRYGVHLISSRLSMTPYGNMMSTVPVRSVEDFDGLKIRTFGAFAYAVEALGASIVPMPGAEMYMALAMGVVDAVMWGGAFDFKKWGLHEVAPYYIGPAWSTHLQMEFLINADLWNEMPRDIQTVIEMAAHEARYDMSMWYCVWNAGALAELKELGVEVIYLGEECLEIIEELTFRYWDFLRAKEDPALTEALERFETLMYKLGYW